MVGATYLNKRDARKAEETFKKITTVAPQDSRGPYLVGVALQGQGKTSEAVREFTGSLPMAPAFIEPLVALVRLNLATKQPAAAPRALTEVSGGRTQIGAHSVPHRGVSARAATVPASRSGLPQSA